MATTTVTNTLNLPDREDARRARVKVDLIAATGENHSPGWYSTDSVAIVGTSKTTVSSGGIWSMDLTPNDDANLVPADTVYRVSESTPTRTNPVVYYIEVPSAGGPYWVGDILATPPAELAGALELDVPEATVVGRLAGSTEIEAITLADLKAALDALP